MFCMNPLKQQWLGTFTGERGALQNNQADLKTLSILQAVLTERLLASRHSSDERGQGGAAFSCIMRTVTTIHLSIKKWGC